jgi:MFS family permease
MHNPTLTPSINTQDYTLPKDRSKFKAWVIVLTASLFFFYEFIQMNMMDAISDSLLSSFHINADQLGDMSSYYFLANVIFLFIAGSLLDRCSTRRVILWSLGICVFGTALFGTATSYFWVTFCRFLTGIGSAFCFLSVLRLASRWFPPRRMALVTGLVVTIAMTGGVVAQTPFAALVNSVGWRHTLFIDAAFGLLVWILVVSVVKDFPGSHQEQHQQEQQKLHQIGYFKSLRMAFLRRQNWLGGIYTSTINLPINVLGGLWGIMYLTTTYHFSKMDASYITSMLFIGTIFGSPLAGWASDRMARRKPLMIFGAIVSLLLIFCVIWLPHLDMGMLLTLFFMIGFFSSTQIIGYPLVAESSRRVVTAMSISVVNLATIGGIGVIQRLYGYMLQTHAEQRVHHATTSYAISDFHWAMIIFFVGYVLALLASILVKETYCVQRED